MPSQVTIAWTKTPDVKLKILENFEVWSRSTETSSISVNFKSRCLL